VLVPLKENTCKVFELWLTTAIKLLPGDHDTDVGADPVMAFPPT
jgi:hypothetical protein